MTELIKCPNCQGQIYFDGDNPLTICQYCRYQVRADGTLTSDEPITTVMGETIALLASEELAVPLVTRSSKLPTKVSETMSTSRDNQEDLTVRLVAGNESKPADNRQLATIVFPLESRKPRGVVMVQLAITVNPSGDVFIEMREEGTANTTSVRGKVEVQ
jgi:molecular chaperone DnaK (HSP70)